MWNGIPYGLDSLVIRSLPPLFGRLLILVFNLSMSFGWAVITHCLEEFMFAILSVGAVGFRESTRLVRTVESVVGDDDGDVTACISNLEENLCVLQYSSVYLIIKSLR